MTVGERIKSARKWAKLTQKELASRAGTAAGTIQQYELGKRQPRVEQLTAIATALNVPIDYLLGQKERIIIPGRLKIVEVDDPESKNLRYTIEAEDEEALQFGLQIFENAGVPVRSLTVPARISAALDQLNSAGQQKAVERVEELTDVPKYRREYSANPEET